MASPRIRWTKVNDGGLIPKPRHGHRAIAVRELMIVFGGGNEGIIDDVHAYNTITNQWFCPVVKGDVPCGSAAYGLAADNTRLLFFGGMLEYGRYSQQLHELQIGSYFSTGSISSKWEWKKLRPKPPRFAPAPSPRLGHSFTFVGGKYYVFGGLSNDFPLGDEENLKLPVTSCVKYLNELYVLEFRGHNCNWELPISYGPSPSPRESHSAVGHVDSLGNQKLLIYGGMSGFRLGDLWILDINSMTWSQPIIDGPKPLPRSLHTSSVIGDRMYVFGGWVPVNVDSRMYEREWKCTNTLARLNLNTFMWEEFESEAAEASPQPRAGHCAVVVGSRIYVWSGRDGYQRAWNTQVCCKDLWYLEVGRPDLGGKVQLIKAGTNMLEVTWPEVAFCDRHVLQVMKYTVAPPRTPRNKRKLSNSEESEGRALPSPTVRTASPLPPLPQPLTADDPDILSAPDDQPPDAFSEPLPPPPPPVVKVNQSPATKVVFAPSNQSMLKGVPPGATVVKVLNPNTLTTLPQTKLTSPQLSSTIVKKFDLPSPSPPAKHTFIINKTGNQVTGTPQYVVLNSPTAQLQQQEPAQQPSANPNVARKHLKVSVGNGITKTLTIQGRAPISSPSQIQLALQNTPSSYKNLRVHVGGKTVTMMMPVLSSSASAMSSNNKIVCIGSKPAAAGPLSPAQPKFTIRQDPAVAAAALPKQVPKPTARIQPRDFQLVGEAAQVRLGAASDPTDPSDNSRAPLTLKIVAPRIVDASKIIGQPVAGGARPTTTSDPPTTSGEPAPATVLPKPPINIKISKTPDGAIVSWSPPLVGCPIISYSVLLGMKGGKLGDSDKVEFVSVYNNSQTKTKVEQKFLDRAMLLCPRPTIIFRISARNELGYGPTTQIRWLQDTPKPPPPPTASAADPEDEADAAPI